MHRLQKEDQHEKTYGEITRRLYPQQPQTSYVDTLDQCVICQTHFINGDLCCRLTCNHVLHTGCWHNVLMNPPGSASEPECPICRGPGVSKSIFPFQGTVDTDTPVPPRESFRQSISAARALGHDVPVFRIEGNSFAIPTSHGSHQAPSPP